MLHISRNKKPVLINELTEKDKGDFVEMDNETLQKLISGLNTKDEELPSCFSFEKTYDAQYYAEKFPGFDDFVYDILEQETIELNKHLPNEGHWYFPLTEGVPPPNDGGERGELFPPN